MEWLLTRVGVWAGSFDRMLFGSDYPFYSQDETLEALGEALEALERHNSGFTGKEGYTAITEVNPTLFFERRLLWQNGIRQKRSSSD
jgi:hypothetical protein